LPRLDREARRGHGLSLGQIHGIHERSACEVLGVRDQRLSLELEGVAVRRIHLHDGTAMQHGDLRTCGLEAFALGAGCLSSDRPGDVNGPLWFLHSLVVATGAEARRP
jgi:hypothetical protein